MTPLFPLFEKRINDATAQIISRQIEPWDLFNSGPPVRVNAFDGRQISYQGIGFEGSPRQVFWSRYIEPFLEAMALGELQAAVKHAQERGVDARILLPEVRGLLLSATRRVFNRMATTDRRLRGKGFPNNIPLRSVDFELQQITNFVDKHMNSELEMWKPKPRIEEWYDRNKFWIWFIGSLIALAGVSARFL